MLFLSSFFLSSSLVLSLLFFLCPNNDPVLSLTHAAPTTSSSSSSKSNTKAAADPTDCKGNTPFLLQDTNDNMCLSPHGFTVCDERALWVLNRRIRRDDTFSLVTFLSANHGNGICLERKTSLFGLIGLNSVGLGKCKKRSSQNWEFDFVNKTMVKLSTKGMCLVRASDNNANSVSLDKCSKVTPLLLKYNPTSVHENGFYLKSADGSCFDGIGFRPCIGSGSNKLLWGIGIKYVKGEGKRYFFSFAPKDRNTCLVTNGYFVEKGPCSSKEALSMWALQDGQLSTGNGKWCVSRNADNRAFLTKCSLNQHEYLAMDLPISYTSQDLANMIKNKDTLSAEEQAALNLLLQQHADKEL